MKELIERLIKQGYLKTPLIIEAFRKVKREDFVPEDIKEEASVNAPLPIGYGQTISQPLTVAFMLELLQPKPGDKILDIGAGSGWQSAILAYIVSKNCLKSKIKDKKEKTQIKNKKSPCGKIYAIERIPELVEFGKKNVSKYNYIEKGIVEFIKGDGSKGYPNIASRPELVEGFDKIIAAAAAEKIPDEWKEQMKIGGRLVTPVQSSVWLLIRKSEKDFEEREFPGFAFVPLVEG